MFSIYNSKQECPWAIALCGKHEHNSTDYSALVPIGTDEALHICKTIINTERQMQVCCKSLISRPGSAKTWLFLFIITTALGLNWPAYNPYQWKHLMHWNEKIQQRLSS